MSSHTVGCLSLGRERKVHYSAMCFIDHVKLEAGKEIEMNETDRTSGGYTLRCVKQKERRGENNGRMVRAR